MREKVILQDFTVLIVCPSVKWSTIERRAIFDSTYLRNIGGNPIILCFKGSQIDTEAEKEDIPRIHIGKGKLKKRIGFKFIFELNKILSDERYDIVHCYSLQSAWISSFLLKSNQKISLFFTINQFVDSVQHGILAKWLLRRIDTIFTLSQEIREYVCENFHMPKSKVKSLGSGIDIVKSDSSDSSKAAKTIGCVINNLTELRRISSIVKIFRVLKSRRVDEFSDLSLSIFLGPRIYQKDKAKKILKDLDYEFYEGDIFLYSLENKISELKAVDIFLGVAFDEPLNDFEISSLINSVPVLFPRTAARQSLLFRYEKVGESYLIDDIREAHTKLTEMILNYSKYQKSLETNLANISDYHGLDHYSYQLKKIYKSNFSKRQRFVGSKR
jgi:hypothetical protein